MSFIKSLFFGSEGDYHFCGFDVSFKKGDPPDIVPSSLFCKGRVWNVLNQRYLYALVHEMGHAIAMRFFDCPSRVKIYQDHAYGNTGPLYYYSCSSKVETIITVAGPMLSMAFAGSVLATSLAIRSYIPTPISLWCSLSAAVAMIEELHENILSAYSKNDGDFGSLAQKSVKHLAIASIGQIALLAFSMFAAYRAV
ncbi:MAG TPA: hypothetical protein VLG44_00965 [Chlamydiales bacterium]|nr:hypothetical protein [Chlamydiales bacterium]